MYSPKKQFTVAIVLLDIFIVVLLLIFSPTINLSSVKKPTLEALPAISNQNSQVFILKEGQGIYVEYNGKRFFSTKNQVTVKNISENEQEFKVYRLKEFYLFKVLSEEFELVKINLDYTSPALSDIENKKDEYFKKENVISFKTYENPINIILTVDDKNFEKEAVCAQANVTEDKQYQYNCTLTFTEEKAHKVTLAISDIAGNKIYIFDNNDVKYVIPVSLECLSIPTLTNKKAFTVKCTATKDGFYRKPVSAAKPTETEKVEIVKGQKVDYPIYLTQEGSNKIIIETEDKVGRTFTEEHTISLDSKAPKFESLSIPTSYTVCDPYSIYPYGDCRQGNTKMTITFSSNEQVSGSLITKPVNFKGCVPRGGSSDKFKLTAGQKFSKTIDGVKYSRSCSMEPDYVNISVNISITDAAGNTTKTSKVIKMNVKY